MVKVFVFRLKAALLAGILFYVLAWVYITFRAIPHVYLLSNTLSSPSIISFHSPQLSPSSSSSSFLPHANLPGRFLLPQNGSTSKNQTNQNGGTKSSTTEEDPFGYQGNLITDLPPITAERFLIFQCGSKQTICGGWADREEGLVTAFLLAYLSKRRYGIRIDTPCDLHRFLLPNAYNWTVPDEHIRGRSSITISAIDAGPFIRDINIMNINEKYPQEVIFLSINVDLQKRVVTNPHYTQILPAWAKQGRPQYFRDVWHTLMKPTAEMVGRAETFFGSLTRRMTAEDVDKYQPRRPDDGIDSQGGGPLGQRAMLIGVHVRTGKYTNYTDSVFFGDPGKYMKTGLVWDFLTPFVNNGSDVFLATDNPDVVHQAKVKFGSRVHHTQATFKHIDLQRNDISTCRAFGDAILDQLILTKCDALMVSPKSGFSSRAAMIRGTNKGLFWYMYASHNIRAVKMDQLCIPLC